MAIIGFKPDPERTPEMVFDFIEQILNLQGIPHQVTPYPDHPGEYLLYVFDSKGADATICDMLRERDAVRTLACVATIAPDTCN